jgi:Kelch motif
MRRRLPYPTQHAGGAALHRRLYVVGGEDRRAPLRRVQRYDPSTNRWRVRAPLPARRSHVGVVAADGRIYAIGGTAPGLTPSRSLFRYNPSTDRWGARTAMPVALSGVAAATEVVNSHATIFVFGGRNNAGRPRALTSAYDTATDAWTALAPMPVALADASAVRIGSVVFVLGGTDASGVASSRLFAYDVATDAWATEAPIRSNTFGPIGAVAGRDGRIYAIGLDWSGRRVDSYDPATGLWSGSPPDLRRAQAFPTAARIGRRIYAAGGNPASLTLSSATLESLRVT